MCSQCGLRNIYIKLEKWTFVNGQDRNNKIITFGKERNYMVVELETFYGILVVVVELETCYCILVVVVELETCHCILPFLAVEINKYNKINTFEKE